MARLSFISSNVVMVSPQNLLVQSLNANCMHLHIYGNGTSKYAHLEFKEYGSLTLRRSFSLTPMRLPSKRMRKFSVQSSALNELGVFLRKNMKRAVVLTFVSVAMGFCYLVFRFLTIPSPKVVAYSDLVTSLQTGSVSKVLFEEGSRRIYFNINHHNVEEESISEDQDLSSENENAVGEITSHGSLVKVMGLFRQNMRKPASAPAWQFSTRKIDHDEIFLLNLMREKGTVYSSAPQSALISFRSVLITIITLWIPLMPLFWLLHRQINASNNSSGKKRRTTNQGVGFEDVEGVDSAKMELMEIVLCLQGAIDYKKLGARVPKGVLLVGPPGTGKTLLARAVAGEAGVAFFSVSASEFVELFVGRGAARIRDLFKEARKCAPSIVFIDEVDAVGGKRGRSFNDERDQTLNQLLTEMDGFESDTKVVVIAATNRPEALDPALCRPGRFSRKVVVGEPDEQGRRKILGVHLRDIPLEEDVHVICSLVSSVTHGLVGADLANIVNESALLAARRGAEAVSRDDIMEAIERAKSGIGGNDNSTKNNKKKQSLSKEFGRLFQWMPSLMGGNDDISQGLLGYRTYS
ncbi:hypothetical protein V2J09_016333 [Rumex salicifolius]